MTMHPRLERYITRLHSLIWNHWLIIDRQVDFISLSDRAIRIQGRITVLDGSLLYWREIVIRQGHETIKVDYGYQFRTEDELGFFRYDSESHGRPQPYHHKHTYQQPIRELETAPSLFDMLKEIEAILISEMT